MLDVARAPIVEQREAEDHLLGLLFGQHRAHRRRLPDHDADLEFEIQPLARSETRQLRRRRLELAAGAMDLCAADHHGRGPAVVADRDVQPVRQQRIGLVAEHGADIGGVFLRRIEIGEAGDAQWQMQLHLAHREQRLGAQLRMVAQLGIVVPQQRVDPRPRPAPDVRPERHEGIDRRLREHVFCNAGFI